MGKKAQPNLIRWKSRVEVREHITQMQSAEHRGSDNVGEWSVVGGSALVHVSSSHQGGALCCTKHIIQISRTHKHIMYSHVDTHTHTHTHTHIYIGNKGSEFSEVGGGVMSSCGGGVHKKT